jgi:hypothetical protein
MRVPAAGLIALTALGFCTSASASGKEFTTLFNIKDCTFSTQGVNRYFILEPGFQLVLMGPEDGAQVELRITVLPDRQSVTLPGIGVIVTRVIEEREWADGMLSEVSRNLFAICEQTGSVFYFGEEVDIYEDGQVVGHEGAWQAGVNGAEPGIVMPGEFLVGSRYFQEMAPGVAMDRAENIKMGLTIDVPAGHYTDAVKVRETSPLESSKGTKIYAPGIGLVVDGMIQLVEVIDPTR